MKILQKLFQPLTFILIGVIARILPHPANFTPIAAMALFGGTYLSKKQAIFVPLLALIISDTLIGFDSLIMRICIYSCFLATTIFGFWLKKHNNYKNIIFASFISSVLFFIITNFAVWLWGNMYLKTPGGLLECYTLALPFFRNTILGDFFYSGMFFGSYKLVNNVLPAAWRQMA